MITRKKGREMDIGFLSASELALKIKNKDFN